MKSINLTISAATLFLALFLAGCGTSGGASGGTNSQETATSNSEVNVDNPTISLADYLRRVPGVNVRGSGGNVQIVIQGVNTFMGNTAPLFYIDQTRVGRNYDQVQSMLNMDSVDRIEVVKGVEASAYGMEGTNGVIIIHTKNNAS